MSEETTPETTEAPRAAAEDKQPKQIDRTTAIAGAIVGVIVGAGLAAVIMMPIEANSTALPGSGANKVQAASAAPPPSAPRANGEPATPSYAQQGEDLVMMQILLKRGIKHPTYVDVGAHEPVINNNTYWFYKAGGDGVLVEPNPTYAAKLRSMRPRDTVIEVGVGLRDEAEADYYVLDGDGQLSTFSKKRADAMVSMHHRKIVKTLKRKIVQLGQVLEQNFKQGSPHVLSIDADSLNYEILKTVDWRRWRPLVVCVETLDPDTGKVDHDILDLMQKNGYAVRGGSEINTIFLDEQDAAPPAPSASH